MKSQRTFFCILFALLSLPLIAQLQAPSGLFYPVQPEDNYEAGYHKIGGTVSGTNGFAGHFMSPSYERTDPQTNRSGNYIDPYYHNGMDVMAAHGTAVYAISDGVMVDDISTGGWTSPGGTTNVAVILLHTTSSGQQFKAVYGHLEDSTVDRKKFYRGASVLAGQQIGSVGTWNLGNHLHFGIFPSGGTLPFYEAKNSAGQVISAQSYGYGRIGIDYWSGQWPDRKGWVDPVFFIETNCPRTSANCPTADLVAKSDMKEYLVAKVNPALTTDSANFGFIRQDQYYEYRYQWFYSLEAGNHWHYYLANHATYLNDRSQRWVIYKDMDSQQVYGWFQILVFP